MILKKINLFDITAVTLIGAILSYALLFRDISTFAYILGGIISALLLNYIPDSKAFIKILLCIAMPLTALILSENTFHLSLTYLVGLNFATLYFQIKHFETSFFNNHLINIIVIGSLIFIDALSKFRGFNKLELENISLTIIGIVIFNLIVFSLSAIFYSTTVDKLKKQQIEAVKTLKVFFPLMILI